MLGLAFSSKLEWCSYITSIAKTAFKKIGALMCSMTFLSPELLCISINLPYCHAWNIVVMFGLVPLATTWNCQISYNNRYLELLGLELLLLLSLILFYRYYFHRCSSELALHIWFHFLLLKEGLLVVLTDCMICLSPFLDVTRMSMLTVSSLAQLDSGILCLQNAFL